MQAAIAVEKSENAKLGDMATTYAGRQSCPMSCPLKASGACYGNMGPVSYVWKRMVRVRRAAHLVYDIIAKQEAAAIDKLSGKVPLRLHTLGDCATPSAAWIVSGACERYSKRHGQPVFGFTHAWRVVPRENWRTVSILASCERPGDAQKAMNEGYAAALIVPDFESTSAYKKQDMTLLPCPKQTGKADSCNSCRLCMRAPRLLANHLVIAFKAHGPSKKCKAVLEEQNSIK